MDIPKLQEEASCELKNKAEENVTCNEVKKMKISMEEEEDSLFIIEETETKYGGLI